MGLSEHTPEILRNSNVKPGGHGEFFFNNRALGLYGQAQGDHMFEIVIRV